MEKTKYAQECLRCGHKWTSYKLNIRACIKCKSYNFNKVKNQSQEAPEVLKEIEGGGVTDSINTL